MRANRIRIAPSAAADARDAARELQAAIAQPDIDVVPSSARASTTSPRSGRIGDLRHFDGAGTHQFEQGLTQGLASNLAIDARASNMERSC
jgi:hypothetical protein